MLYLVSTPIGHLDDFSFRAVSTLKECSLILAEDTRHSGTLMKRYEIETPLMSYHQHNETERRDQILQRLAQGEHIALISDAGSPSISDPGQPLVAACRESKLPVTFVPGASAVTTALVLSGFSTAPYQFIGFLPKKEQALLATLVRILHYPGTTVCFESPNRIQSPLKLLSKIAPTIQVAVCRELTKRYEEVYSGTASNVLQWCEEKSPRGEMVLVISEHIIKTDWTDLPPTEHLHRIEKEYGVNRKEALRMVADIRGESRRDLYSQIFG